MSDKILPDTTEVAHILNLIQASVKSSFINSQNQQNGNGGKFIKQVKTTEMRLLKSDKFSFYENARIYCNE